MAEGTTPTAIKSPLALVKGDFGDKAKLVAAIEKLAGADLWVARTNEKKGLGHVSNAKLLKLHATFSEVKEKFGTREKLIDAILELEKRAKDTGWRQKLSEWPVPRLYDAYRSAKKRADGGGEAAPVKSTKTGAKVAAEPTAKPKVAKKGQKTATKAAAASRKPAKKATKAGSKGSKPTKGRKRS